MICQTIPGMPARQFEITAGSNLAAAAAWRACSNPWEVKGPVVPSAVQSASAAAGADSTTRPSIQEEIANAAAVMNSPIEIFRNAVTLKNLFSHG